MKKDTTAKKNVNVNTKATKEGRKDNMKKTTAKKESGIAFDINAYNSKMILEHADGTREAITAAELHEKNEARYNKEKVDVLRKWANNRGINGSDKMKKKELVAALVADDAKPKEEKEAAKKARKEAAQKKDATAKKEAAAAADADKPQKQKKQKKDAQKPQKKEEATPKMESVQTSLEKEDARIVCAMDVQNMQNADIADALNRIKTLKLYEAKGADNMADFINNKCATAEEKAEGKSGRYHGMTYSHVNKYINAHNYVYSMKDADGAAYFIAYGWHLIQALIAPCRHHGEAVREAVKDGRITASMSLKSLNELIEAEGWKKKKEKDGAQTTTTVTAEDAEAEAATTAAAELPKVDKHNGIKIEDAELAAAALSKYIDESKASKTAKAAAEAALNILMKYCDI